MWVFEVQAPEMGSIGASFPRANGIPRLVHGKGESQPVGGQ